MSDGATTAAVRAHLELLQGVNLPDPVIRSLLGRVCERLTVICSHLLRGDYPRLTRPPQNLESGDVLGEVILRLTSAIRDVRPTSPRQFFGLARQHLRWVLHTHTRLSDRQSGAVNVPLDAFPHPPAGDSDADLWRAIFELPEEVQEAFELVHIWHHTHEEAAEVTGVSEKTIQNRIRQGERLLARRLPNLGREVNPPTGEAGDGR